MAKKDHQDIAVEVAAMERESDSRLLTAITSTRKRLPVGMLGSSVVVWGAATEHWLWAALVAVLLEVVNILPIRGQLNFATYRRAWFVTIFFLWGLGISSWLENPTEAVRHVLTWAPLTLLPLVLTGLAGRHSGVPLTVFPYLFRSKVRRYRASGIPFPSPRFSPHVPFIAALLLGASYSWKEESGHWYFFALAILFIVWVWVDEAGLIRDVKLAALRRRVVLKMLLALGVLAVFAASTSEGIHRLHQWVENGGLSGGRSSGGVSGNRSSISLGDIGEIQLNDSIVWRVKSLVGVAPDRLTDGVYDELTASNVWLNKAQREFDPLGGGKVDLAQDSWPLVNVSKAGSGAGVDAWRFELFGQTQDEFTVLPLPAGAQGASNLPAFEVQRNGYGVVRVNAATSVLRPNVLAARGEGEGRDIAPPDRYVDLNLQKVHFKPFMKLANELNLSGKPTAEVVSRVRAYFADGFEYSLTERPERLTQFISEDKRGHCELFASATVLLCRAAGVPARYHTGFMVSEFDEDAGYYNLRGTHAHAWAEIWNGKRWEVLDTTPPGWMDLVGGDKPWWRAGKDKIDLWMMSFRDWRGNLETGGWAGSILPWAIVAVVLYTIVRVWMGRREMFGGGGKSTLTRSIYDNDLEGGPTLWESVRPELEKRFGEIPDSQPAMRWVRQVEGVDLALREILMNVVSQHYKQRFGRAEDGDDAEMRRALELQLVDGAPR